MLLADREALFNRISKRRVRRVEHPLEALFPQHLGRRLGGVHAELIHVKRHTAKRVLGPQLLDESSELFLVDGLGEGHEQIEPVFL